MDKHALFLVNGSLGRRRNDQALWDVMCVGVLTQHGRHLWFYGLRGGSQKNFLKKKMIGA